MENKSKLETTPESEKPTLSQKKAMINHFLDGSKEEKSFNESGYPASAFEQTILSYSIEGALKAGQAIRYLKPKNPMELNLVIQMEQNINLTNKLFYLTEKEYDHNKLSKIANLAFRAQEIFMKQTEALCKLRGEGGQKVTVEHVHVHSGGQAIVGVVEGGGGDGKDKNKPKDLRSKK